MARSSRSPRCETTSASTASQLRALDDATAARGGWDPGQTTINVRDAVLDPTTIGYIGELNSGASAVSIPPLNRAGIPQISPTSTAVGLTSGAAGASPGEPMKYYPTGVRTFARVVPNDTVQAVAQVRSSTAWAAPASYVLNDGEVDGVDMADSFELAACPRRPAGGGHPDRSRATPPATRRWRRAWHRSGPTASCSSAATESGAVRLTTQLAAAMPNVKIFGTAGSGREHLHQSRSKAASRCRSTPQVVLTVATLALADYPAVRARVHRRLRTRRYGPPQPLRFSATRR